MWDQKAEGRGDKGLEETDARGGPHIPYTPPRGDPPLRGTSLEAINDELWGVRFIL